MYGGLDVHNEPIKRITASRLLDAEYAIRYGKPDTRWPIQLALFEARMAVLQEMIAKDMVGCQPATESVLVQITRPVIPAFITGGKDIYLPEGNTHFSYITNEQMVW